MSSVCSPPFPLAAYPAPVPPSPPPCSRGARNNNPAPLPPRENDFFRWRMEARKRRERATDGGTKKKKERPPARARRQTRPALPPVFSLPLPPRRAETCTPWRREFFDASATKKIAEPLRSTARPQQVDAAAAPRSARRAPVAAATVLCFASLSGLCFVLPWLLAAGSWSSRVLQIASFGNRHGRLSLLSVSMRRAPSSYPREATSAGALRRFVAAAVRPPRRARARPRRRRDGVADLTVAENGHAAFVVCGFLFNREWDKGAREEEGGARRRGL